MNRRPRESKHLLSQHEMLVHFIRISLLDLFLPFRSWNPAGLCMTLEELFQLKLHLSS